MHQNIAVILQQFNYGKYSFILLIPGWFEICDEIIIFFSLN